MAVAAAAPEAGTKYTGNTSQGFTTSIRTNEAGTGLKAFTIRRRFSCGGNQTVVGTFRQTGGAMAIRETGRFYAHDNLQRGGSIRRGVFTIRGRFGSRGKSARGTYRERVKVESGSRCDTGTIRFRISAGS